MNGFDQTIKRIDGISLNNTNLILFFVCFGLSEWPTKVYNDSIIRLTLNNNSTNEKTRKKEQRITSLIQQTWNNHLVGIWTFKVMLLIIVVCSISNNMAVVELKMKFLHFLIISSQSKYDCIQSNGIFNHKYTNKNQLYDSFNLKGHVDIYWLVTMTVINNMIILIICTLISWRMLIMIQNSSTINYEWMKVYDNE
jgi:hypothetical protein